jgi:hypothetical protein
VVRVQLQRRGQLLNAPLALDDLRSARAEEHTDTETEPDIESENDTDRETESEPDRIDGQSSQKRINTNRAGLR